LDLEGAVEQPDGEREEGDPEEVLRPEGEEGEQRHEPDQRPAADESGDEEQGGGTEPQYEGGLGGQLVLGEPKVGVGGLRDVHRDTEDRRKAGRGEREASLALIDLVHRPPGPRSLAPGREHRGPSVLLGAVRSGGAVLVVGFGHAGKANGARDGANSRAPAKSTTSTYRPEGERRRRSPRLPAGGISHQAAPTFLSANAARSAVASEAPGTASGSSTVKAR